MLCAFDVYILTLHVQCTLIKINRFDGPLFVQIYDGVKPTLGELEKFEATPEEVEVEGAF